MTEAAAVTVVDLSPGAEWTVVAATHIGPVRSQNQDAFAAVDLAGEGIGVVVADGMGGLPGGAEAAQTATEAVIEVMARGTADEATAVAALHAANRAVAALQAELGGQPGTTLTIAALRAGGASIAHAGDSRAYLVRALETTVLTTDHSWVGDQVRAGALPAGSERRHPRRNVITMAVMGGDIDPQVTSTALEDDAVLVLCSDGFWEPLSDQQIGTLLGAAGPLEEVVTRAVEAALEAGATDNVTVVAVRSRV